MFNFDCLIFQTKMSKLENGLSDWYDRLRITPGQYKKYLYVKVILSVSR